MLNMRYLCLCCCLLLILMFAVAGFATYEYWGRIKRSNIVQANLSLLGLDSIEKYNLSSLLKQWLRPLTMGL